MAYRDIERRRAKDRDRYPARREYIRAWKAANQPTKKPRVVRAPRSRDEINAERRRTIAEFRARLAALKIERGCTDCGYNDHPAALDFDHLPGVEKRAGVAQLVKSLSWATVAAEIAKCEVVCANCHRVRTVRRGQHHREAA